MSSKFCIVEEGFPTFNLQSALIKYNSKFQSYGFNKTYVDIADVFIRPDEDYIDLFISLIFAVENDGISRFTFDGVVSQYIEDKDMDTSDGITSLISYRRVHERSFINKEFKANIINFVNNNIDFDITIREKKLYKDIDYCNVFKFSKSEIYTEKENELLEVLTSCKLVCEFAKEHKLKIELCIPRELYKEKVISTVPVVRIVPKHEGFVIDTDGYYDKGNQDLASYYKMKLKQDKK